MIYIEPTLNILIGKIVFEGDEMKRSDINKAIKEMEEFLDEARITLPHFSKWTPKDWLSKNHEYDEIKNNCLGWDVTDAGLDNFDEVGFTLFTCRNGKYNSDDKKRYKPYAEKMIMIKENQCFPYHFHWYKTEDIINRYGGTLLITVYNDDGNGGFSDDKVLVNSDGREYYVGAGTAIELEPGQSITLWPHQYHKFSVKPGTGDVLVGEVSMCNDDDKDNRFYKEHDRFPTIIEDEEPYRLLCNEYPNIQ